MRCSGQVQLASLQVPNLECGWDCFLKQSQPPARPDGACWSPSWETRVFTAACRRQPHAAFGPIKVSYGKFRPRWASRGAAGGVAGGKWCLSTSQMATCESPPAQPCQYRALIPSLTFVAGGVCTLCTKCPQQQTLRRARKGKLSSWI